MAHTTSSMLHRQCVGPSAEMLRPVSQFVGRGSTVAFRELGRSLGRRGNSLKICHSHARTVAGAPAVLLKPVPALAWRSQQRTFAFVTKAASAEPAVTATGELSRRAIPDSCQQAQHAWILLAAVQMLCVLQFAGPQGCLGGVKLFRISGFTLQ